MPIGLADRLTRSGARRDEPLALNTHGNEARSGYFNVGALAC